MVVTQIAIVFAYLFVSKLGLKPLSVNFRHF